VYSVHSLSEYGHIVTILLFGHLNPEEALAVALYFPRRSVVLCGRVNQQPQPHLHQQRACVTNLEEDKHIEAMIKKLVTAKFRLVFSQNPKSAFYDPLTTTPTSFLFVIEF
jgi:hypothetical protein